MFVLFGGAPSAIGDWTWRVQISQIALFWVAVVIKRGWEWCTFQAKEGLSGPIFREKTNRATRMPETLEEIK